MLFAPMFAIPVAHPHHTSRHAIRAAIPSPQPAVRSRRARSTLRAERTVSCWVPGEIGGAAARGTKWRDGKRLYRIALALAPWAELALALKYQVGMRALYDRQRPSSKGVGPVEVCGASPDTQPSLTAAAAPARVASKAAGGPARVDRREGT
jgi:hypothetical protein